MRTAELRQKFLSFFETRAHRVVKSDSLIPREDPTLLFTGAGMNQFKDYFMGIKQDMKRATSVQKCLRTGDLDNVGRTPYHHSFFEMLGNFSFGDYFKSDAIGWGWEFLTKELKIPAVRLRVSVYKDDTEAYSIWEKKIGVRKDWIYRFDDKMNFWPAGVITEGPNGPCGPCSEIYYDQGEDIGCKRSACGVDCDCGRFAEIWNLVFTQFDRQSDGSLVPLKAKNIDTGMGLERLACVLQGKRSNFEIDLFDGIREAIKKRMPSWDERFRPDLYAVCDHLRAVAFAVGDGVYPSNEGRGYVIRKLIRRALWRAKKLGLKLPVLWELIPSVVEAMGDFYTELREDQEYITKVTKNEEERFLQTLDRGLNLIADKKQFSSEDVFQLYDTYGFPVELVRSIAEERGIPLELDRFENLMEKQRERAKQATKISEGIFVADEFKTELLKRKIRATIFRGYEKLKWGPTEIWALVDSKGKFLDKLEEGDEGLLVVGETPFYAESGGQVGDQGEFSSVDGKTFGDIFDTFKREEVFFHRLKIASGRLGVGNKILLSVNEERRRRTMYNHTATHLLHAALRKVLGEHVRQLGSVVEPRRIRFDFSHFQAMTTDEIKQVENLVNQEIERATPVSAVEKEFAKAKEEGAMAFFGDKYGARVRVVTVGQFSKELCGGTHVSNIKEIGRMKIISESSIASGTRRIEAVTSTGVEEYNREKKLLQEQEKNRESAKRAEEELKAKQASERLMNLDYRQLINSATTVGSVNLVVKYFDGKWDNSGLGSVVDKIKPELSSSVMIMCGESGGKLSIVTACTGDLINTVSANDLMRKITPLVDGHGGGRKDFAQGGGSIPLDQTQFLIAVSQIVTRAVSK